MTEIATEPDSQETERLLQELAETQDFPALSHTIVQINSLVGSDATRADELTKVILRDVSITNKLLRIVNAAQYGKFGGRPINTVSRAVLILGFNMVRDVALSLMLFEHLQNHAQARQLKGEAIETFFCGLVSSRLTRLAGLGDSEEAFISGLFINIGRLMARFYFFDRTEQVQALMLTEDLDENAAARRVFGTSYDQLGLAIARQWRLPASIIHGMTPLPAGQIKKPNTANERLQTTTNLARDLYRVCQTSTRPEEQLKGIQAVRKRYGEVGPLPVETLQAILHDAADEIKRDAIIFEGGIGSSPVLTRLLGKAAMGKLAEEAAAEGEAAGLEILADEAEAETADPAAVLTAGLQDLTDALLSDAKITDILHMVLESYYRTGCFDRVMIAVRDKDGRSLSGRFGYGARVDAAVAAFKVQVHVAADVFSAAAMQGLDILIADARAENIRSRIPAWHKDDLGAHSFLLLPVNVNKKPFALIYVAKQDAALDLDHHVVNLLKVMRNQALLALRQAA